MKRITAITQECDFTLRIRAKRIGYYSFVKVSFDEISNIIVNLISLPSVKSPVSYSIDSEGRLVIPVTGESLVCNMYGIEILGFYNNGNWRHQIAPAFEIVKVSAQDNYALQESDDCTIDYEITLGETYASSRLLEKSVEGHNNDPNAHANIQQAITDLQNGLGNAGTIHDVEVDGESVVEIDPQTGKHVVRLSKDQLGKVDDVKVNGESVLNENNEAEIEVPTKVSDLENDSDYATKEEAQAMADEEKITEVVATVDNNVGIPEVNVSYEGQRLQIAFQNLKGETGEQGIQGKQGPQGDSVLVGQGDLPLANTLGDSSEKAISQKAVTEVLEPIMLYQGEKKDITSLVTSLWTKGFATNNNVIATDNVWKYAVILLKAGQTLTLTNTTGINPKFAIASSAVVAVGDTVQSSKDSEYTAEIDTYVVINSGTAFTSAVIEQRSGLKADVVKAVSPYLVDFSQYRQCNRGINRDSLVWEKGDNWSYFIPIPPSGCVEISQPSTRQNFAQVAFLQSLDFTSGQAVSTWADGEIDIYRVKKGGKRTLEIPAGAKYMYVFSYWKNSDYNALPNIRILPGNAERDYESYGYVPARAGYIAANGTVTIDGQFMIATDWYSVSSLAGMLVRYTPLSNQSFKNWVILDDEGTVIAVNDTSGKSELDIDTLIEEYPEAYKILICVDAGTKIYILPKNSSVLANEKLKENIDDDFGPIPNFSFENTEVTIVSTEDEDAADTEDGNINAGWIGKIGDVFYLFYLAARKTLNDSEGAYYIRSAYSTDGATWQRGFPDGVTPPVAGTNKLFDEGGLTAINIFKVQDEDNPYRAIVCKTVGSTNFYITFRLYKSVDGIHWTYMKDILNGPTKNMDGYPSVIVRGNIIKMYVRDWDSSHKNRQVGVVFLDIDGNIIMPMQRYGLDYVYEAPALPIDDRRELLMPTYFNNMYDNNQQIKLLTYIANGYRYKEIETDINDLVQEGENWARVCAGSIMISGVRYIALNTSQHCHDDSAWMAGDMVSKTRLVKVVIPIT